MYSNEEAEHLIGLPKEVDGLRSIDLSNSQTRLSLIAPNAPEYIFLAEITLNKKIDFKVSLHHQENSACIGLLRIDYRGRHTNPESDSPSLPSKFKPYIGTTFGINEPHMHCYVAGYKPLAWALPLTAGIFPVLQIANDADKINAILQFVKKINVTSHLTVQSSII